MSSSRRVLGAFAVICALVALQEFLQRPGNLCHMTYMPAPPQYIDIPLSANITKKFPNYKLYVYGEGHSGRQLRQGHIYGIPVLFVHGNAGNFGQARSLGSILQLKANMLNIEPVFNVFTVDFNEELSALYGGHLPLQAEFLAESIKAITSLLNGTRTSPSPMVIVGHSMGGVISRSLYLNPDFDTSQIAFHVELAAPTRRPVFFLDSGLWKFYDELHQLWEDVGTLLPPVVSVMGGDRDLQVRPTLGTSNVKLKLLSESVPHVWVTSDHACMAWCKQLQLTITRVLFDLVVNNSLTEDRQRTVKVLNFHFLNKFAQHKYLSTLARLPKSVQFPTGRTWVEKFEASWRFDKKKIVSGLSLIVPVYRESSFIILAFGLKNDDWLYGCTEVKREGGAVSCLSGVDISRQNTLVPPLKSKIDNSMFVDEQDTAGRLYHATGQDLYLRKFQALVINVPSLLENVIIVGERLKRDLRETVFDSRKLLLGPGFFSTTNVISINLANRGLFHRLNMANFQHVWQAYTLRVHCKLCLAGASGSGLVHFQTGWSHEGKYFWIRGGQDSVSTFTLKLDSGVNPRVDQNSTVDFYFDPECAYDVFLQFDMRTFLGKILVHHGEWVLSYCFALALVVLARQMADLGRLGICFSFSDSLSRSATFLGLTIVPTILESLSFLPQLPPLLAPYLSRSTDASLSSLEILTIRILMYSLALGVICLLAKVLEVSLLLSSRIYIRSKKFMGRGAWSDSSAAPQLNEDSSSRVVTAAIVALIGVSLGVGGGPALVGAFVTHLTQVLCICCRNVFLEDRKGTSAFTSRWKLQSTLILLHGLCLVTYAPSLAAWLRQFPQPLNNDPLKLTAPLLLFFSTIVLQPSVPHPNRYYYCSSGYLIYLLAITSVLFCLQHLYRLCYLQLVVWGLIFFQQNFKP